MIFEKFKYEKLSIKNAHQLSVSKIVKMVQFGYKANLIVKNDMPSAVMLGLSSKLTKLFIQKINDEDHYSDSMFQNLLVDYKAKNIRLVITDNQLDYEIIEKD